MVLKKCIICGEPFDARGRAKCCRPECSKINESERMREYGRKWREENPEYDKERYENNRKPNIKTCIICGEEFDARTSTKCCSPECRKENRRRTKKKWGENNRDKKRESQKKWLRNNRDKQYKSNLVYKQKRISGFCEQYDGNLELILENCCNSWMEREAKMRIWFDESYVVGMVAKIESTPVCEVTGEKDNLVIHHLYSFNTHPELGNEVANMVRITKAVHKDFHNIYGQCNNTPEQWMEFLQKRGDFCEKNQIL